MYDMAAVIPLTQCASQPPAWETEFGLARISVFDELVIESQTELYRRVSESKPSHENPPPQRHCATVHPLGLALLAADSFWDQTARSWPDARVALWGAGP